MFEHSKHENVVLYIPVFHYYPIKALRRTSLAIAMQSLILTATGLGLATCWIANFDEEEVKKATEIPDDWRIAAMTPLG
jgi:nitroreductase